MQLKWPLYVGMAQRKYIDRLHIGGSSKTGDVAIYQSNLQLVRVHNNGTTDVLSGDTTCSFCVYLLALSPGM